ncbi:MAG: TonB-dependent receptor plug domain-containing protein, partial [Schwartzia sp. (in: firmicutes)]
MLKQKLTSSILTSLLFTGGFSCHAYAAETLDEYTLDAIVVTAQRTETRDLNTPATTTVITAKDIENRGYLSVFDALDQTVGITSYNYTSGQGDNGSSTGRVYIRGLDKGTLILVNGAPVNLNNYNSTAGIPISAVERIEIVKGSNSVLYGSEAMGGVVNIITKQGGRAQHTASVTVGDVNSGGELTSRGDKYLVS